MGPFPARNRIRLTPHHGCLAQKRKMVSRKTAVFRLTVFLSFGPVQIAWGCMVDTSVRWARPPWQGVAVSIRSACVSLTVRTIDEAFSAELGGLHPRHDAREKELIEDLGQRRARATVWLERIAWTEDPPIKLGEILERLRSPLQTADPSAWDAIGVELTRVGWRSSGYAPLVDTVGFGDFPELTDARGIGGELSRLDSAVQSGDVHATVGHVKNVVEAAAKFAYPSVVGPLPNDPKFTPLVSTVGERLAVGIESEGSKASVQMAEFVRRLTASVLLMGPLRNRVNGTAGHGAPVWDSWLQDTHSRLVAEVGVAWARFVLQQVSEDQVGDPVAAQP